MKKSIIIAKLNSKILYINKYSTNIHKIYKLPKH